MPKPRHLLRRQAYPAVKDRVRDRATGKAKLAARAVAAGAVVAA